MTHSEKTKYKFWAVIPAAGVGSRMQAERPKQYLQLQGKTILEHTLARFLDHPMINGIVLVISEGDPYWQKIETVLTGDKPLLVATGGQERCDSVLNGLKILGDQVDKDDWVLVHDAARPCLTSQDIDKLIVELDTHAVGGILARPVHDTMKRDDGHANIAATVERKGLWHALTPQMFRYQILLDALSKALDDGYQVTDEASAMEHAGLTARLVEGRPENIKITRPEDLQLAALYLDRLSQK
jgi:2-C-methyl-D-erythritol 4-phosphate cytidylyltransferase